MYLTPTCLDPATVEACQDALAKLRESKRFRRGQPLKEHMAGIRAAAARVEAFAPDVIRAAQGETGCPRERALAYADAKEHANPRGARRLRAWAAA